jgi:hypothetical protein
MSYGINSLDPRWRSTAVYVDNIPWAAKTGDLLNLERETMAQHYKKLDAREELRPQKEMA